MNKTVFVINSGSSSVKASLMCPQSSIAVDADNPQSGDRNGSPPYRILTAHAERLGSKDSCLEVCVSITAMKRIIESANKADSVGPEILQQQQQLQGRVQTRTLRKSDSLQLSSRSTTEQESNLMVDEKCMKPELHTVTITKANLTHELAIQEIMRILNHLNSQLVASIAAVGHRVVHGGSEFSEATLIDEGVVQAIGSVSHLAPLHNPANLIGIRIALNAFQNIPNVAVFDTAFHSTMPRHIYTCPLPDEYTNEYQIRNYGFHGSSVQYVSRIAKKRLDALGKQSNVMIVAHLGNGASATAIVNGQSIDTTMGFTPLSGLMMGTRCGSVDPSIVNYASKAMQKSPDEVMDDLNNRSGLYGISKGDNDMRTIIQRASVGDKDAQLAIDMFIHSLAKHIVGLVVSCGRCIDALVFTAGIGENCPLIRSLTIEKTKFLFDGVQLNNTLNDDNGKRTGGIISVDQGDGCTVLVVPSDEEAMICSECERFFRN